MTWRAFRVARKEEADLSHEPNAQDVIINEVPAGRSFWKGSSDLLLLLTPALGISPLLVIIIPGHYKIQTALRTVLLACMRVRVSLTAVLVRGVRPSAPGLCVHLSVGLCVDSSGNAGVVFCLVM